MFRRYFAFVYVTLVNFTLLMFRRYFHFFVYVSVPGHDLPEDCVEGRKYADRNVCVDNSSLP